MFVAIDRKPDCGCEIQSICCSKSSIMLHLKVVKTLKSRIREKMLPALTINGDIGLNEGTWVVKELCFPWANTNHVAVANSCFASVQMTQKMKKIGHQFIGVVKTSTCKFPMTELSEVHLNKQGKWKSLHCKNEEPKELDIKAFVWVDRDRRHFVSTCSNLRPAVPIVHCWLHQVEDVTTNVPPELVSLSISIPDCAKMHCKACGKMGNHNCLQCNGLKMEKKI